MSPACCPLTSSAGGHPAQWKLLVFWETRGSLCDIIYKQLALSGTYRCYWSVPSRHGYICYFSLLSEVFQALLLSSMQSCFKEKRESWLLIMSLRKVHASTELFFKEPCNQVHTLTCLHAHRWNNSANYPVAFLSRFKGKLLTDVPSLRLTKWQLIFYEGMRSPLSMLLSIRIWKQTTTQWCSHRPSFNRLGKPQSPVAFLYVCSQLQMYLHIPHSTGVLREHSLQRGSNNKRNHRGKWWQYACSIIFTS